MKNLLWGLFAFATLAHAQGTVTDIDGNTYDYLTYGTQQWTVENAAMETYRDGTPIPQVTDATQWSSLTTGAWCYYDNDPTKGKLYNWYAVAGIHDNDPNTPNKEFAPEGWHVPTDAEWTTLEEYLIANGYNYDGTTTGNKIAKSMASTSDWLNSTITGAPGNNQSLNNSSNFNVLPHGYRNLNGVFYEESYDGIVWSSTVDDPTHSWNRIIYSDQNSIIRNNGYSKSGSSVRFIQNSNTCSEVSINASSNNICAGESVDLSVVGDVNSTYLWSTGQSNFSGQGTLVDEYSLIANTVSQNTFSTIPGNIYRLEVSGTISLGGGAGNQRDVAYYTQSGPDGTTEGTPFDSACNLRIWTSLFCDTPGLRPSPDIYDASTHTYSYPFTANSSTLDVGFWDSPLGDNGPNVVTFKLYELSNSESTITVSPTETTEYWVDVTTNGVTCREYVTINVTAPAAPTGPLTQAYCNAATVADLTAIGENIQWYDAATGGNLLDSTTALTDGQMIYASQTVNGCESTDRLEVTVSIQDITITASATEVCAGESVDLTVSSGLTAGTTACTSTELPENLQTGLVGYWPFCGNANDESGNGNNGTVNGATLTTDRFGNPDSAFDFDGANSIINLPEIDSNIGTPGEITTYSMWFNGRAPENGSTSGQIISAFVPGSSSYYIRFETLYNANGNGNQFLKTYYRASGINNEPGATFNNTPITWHNVTVVVDGSLGEYKYYFDGVNLPEMSFSFDPNHNYYSPNRIWQIGRMNPAPNTLPHAFLGEIDDLAIWNRALSASEIQQLANSSIYTWSTGDTTENITVTPTETTEYWVDVTTNGVTCREYVTINVTAPAAPTGDSEQTFCDVATVADLTATGDNIKWYDAATGGNLLDSTTALTDGQMVYASQIVNGCESTERLEVTVSVQDITITASATEVCAGESVDLTLSSGLTAGTTACTSTELPENLQTGLVGYWPFCGNANDESGNGNNGTVNGATLTSDRFGNLDSAYSFNGDNSYINNPTQLLEIGSNYSVSFWFSSTDVNQGNQGPYASQTLFNSIGDTGIGIAFNHVYNPGVISLFIGDGLNFWDVNGSAGIKSNFNNNQWYNVTLVKNGINYKMYVDGILDIDINVNSSINYTSSVGFTIGTGSEGVNEPLFGSNDDLIFWNRALTETEVLQLVDAPSPFNHYEFFGEFQGTAYYVSTNPVDFSTASSFNSDNGVSFLTITSEQENNFLTSGSLPGFLWLGCSDLNSEGDWNWFNGESFNYSNWDSGEPNNQVGGEDYAEFRTTGFWNDIPIFENGNNILRYHMFETTQLSSILWSTGDNTENISVTPTETTEYWVDVTANGVTCREYVTINVTAPAAPTGDSEQTFCDVATVADLTATGNNIQWYDAATGGNLLDSASALTDGQMVYALQTVNGCESTERLEVTVSIQDITITASATEVCAGESVDLSVVGDVNSTYLWSTGQSNFSGQGTLVDEYSLIANTVSQNTFSTIPGNIYRLEVSGTISLGGGAGNQRDVAYYTQSGPDGTTEGTPFDSACNLRIWTSLFCDTPGLRPSPDIYDASTHTYNYPFTANSSTLDVGFWDSPLGDNGPNVVTFKLYELSNSESTITVSPTETTEYWVDVTTNGVTCREYVTINVTAPAAPTGNPVQGGCSDFTVGSNNNAFTGENLQWYATLSGGTALPDSHLLVDGTYYYISQTIDGCESSDRFEFLYLAPQPIITIDSSVICEGDSTTVSVSSSPSQGNATFLWNTGETSDNVTLSPTESTNYWVDQIYNSGGPENIQTVCRYFFGITVDNAPEAPISGGDISECETITAQSLVATASANAGESITWYDAATGGNVVADPSLSAEGTVTYYAEATNDTSGCASLNRTAVTLTITSVVAPSGDAVQAFCDNVTVSDLSISGSNIQWYDAATGGNVLDPSSALSDGQLLYASQTQNGCESITRLEVSVEIDIIPDPILITTELEFCLAREATLADLEVDEQGFALEWYDSFSGGNMLPMDTLLEDGVSYYATLYDAVSGCESLMRLEVVPTVIPCEVVIYNAISLNDNGVNDYMVIENAEYFPDNSLEVYNRDGHLLYSKTQYGIGDNLFRGIANVSGIYGSTLSGDGPRLPTGSYLYVFKYFNPYEQQQYTLKGFLTINSN